MKRMIVVVVGLCALFFAATVFAGPPPPDFGSMKEKVVGPVEVGIIPIQATGGFSNTYDDYVIFADPNITKSGQIAGYVTGEYPAAIDQLKFELFFRNVVDNKPQPWRVGKQSGCVVLEDHKFLCQFMAPSALLTTGSSGGVKVEILVSRFVEGKVFNASTMEISDPATVTAIMTSPHSPGLMVGDINRDGTAENIEGNVDLGIIGCGGLTDVQCQAIQTKARIERTINQMH